VNRCRLHALPAHPAEELVTTLRGLPTPVISDQMNRTGALRGVRPLPGTPLEPRLAGPALTVKTRPGDNLVVHKAIDLARPGDVLVIDAGGDDERAVMGEIVYRYAVSRGIAGFVIGGAVRDAREIGEGRRPVFASGISHLGPYKSGPGEIGGPISVGGTAVRSGDLVVGDFDGVVVIPAELAEAVAAAGPAQLEKEEAQLASADAGELDRSWIDETLELEEVTFE
jgi:regulator of RNase E activity RraA